jgi:hypothetical protein
MRQHMPDKDLTAIEMNDRNQPIFIAADIKNHPLVNYVGCGKNLSQIGQVSKGRTADQLIPAR